MLGDCMGLGKRRGLGFSLSLAAVAWSAGACTFPDFKVIPGAAGSPDAGVGGSAQAGSNGAGATAGSDPVDGGTPGGGTAAVPGGDGGEAGEAGVIDIGPCGQRQYALHCFNHEQDEDETDIDCGGSRCGGCGADEACVNPRDCSFGSCVNGTCERAFELDYRQDNPDNETASFRLEEVVRYLGSEPLLLRDITVRYYFSRNGVSEPILPSGTVTQSPSGDDLSSSATWRIVRQPRGNGITNDAYLEVGFSGGKILTQNQELDVSAQATSGEDSTLFNQATHHSFDPDTDLHESKKISVHYKGLRVWGSGPKVDDPATCFLQGVNLDGTTLKVGDDQWLASPASGLARYIDTNITLKPSTDAGREEMLRAGFLFQDDQFSYPVDNGTYELIVYVWAAGGSEKGTLQVEGQEQDGFRCFSFAGGGPWAPLGPYRIDIDDGMLTLGAAGVLRAGGFELRRVDEE